MLLRAVVRALPSPARLAAAVAVGVFCAAPAPVRAADPVVTVASLNPDSGVWLTPCCGMNLCAQVAQETPFTYSCPAGTSVRLEAPASVGENPFTEWRYPNQLPYRYATYIFVPDRDLTVTVVYGTPVEPRPDFAVTGIALTPASPVTGLPFSAQVTVTNQGAGVQPIDAWVDIWGNLAAAPGCGASGIAALGFGPLAPAASRVLTFANLTAGPAGPATFRAFVDAYCLIGEEDETNNQAVLAYTVRPRRTLEVRSTAPASGVPAIVGAADMLGQGDGSTPFTRYYNDGESVPLAVPPVAASGNLFQHWLRDGAHFSDAPSIAAVMDADHVFTAIYAPPPVPNFVITGITLPDHPNAGFAFRATVTVRNAGTAAGDGGTLAVWTDKLFNDACYYYDAAQFRSVGTLGVGESRTFTFTGLGPVAAGSRHFRATADATCLRVESEDGDNSFIKDYVVSGSETASLTVDTLDWRHVAIAHTMDVTGEVSGTTRFDRTYPKGATVTLTAPASSPDGGVFQKWVAVGATITTTPGVTLVLDSGKSIQAVYVGPGEPDFAVTALAIDPPDPPAGGTFTATATITNVGTGRGVPGGLKFFPGRGTPAACGGWTPYGPMYIYSLAAGASLTYTVPGIPAGARGPGSLLAFVESFCETDEPDESNNQLFLAYEAVNVPPVLGAIGDRSVSEGATLAFAVPAADANGDPLTFEATGLPVGAEFDPATHIFSWSPGYEAAGRYEGVRFVVGDGEATDEETIAIDVAEPAGPVFVERFEDAGPAGDVDWVPVSGKWTGGEGLFAASSKALVNLARIARLDPDELPIRAGIVRANVRLAAAATSPPGPNALIVFAYRDAGHYRWVRITPARVQIGQRGGMDGVEAGVKRSVAATAPVGRWYRYTVRIEEDGGVRVYRGAATAPLVSWRFARVDGTPSVVAGGIGLAAVKALAHFDDVVVREESALDPP